VDGIDAVLQQLAQEDFGPAVQVVRQQVDDPAEIDLKPIIHACALFWDGRYRRRLGGIKRRKRSMMC
jgi:hypothetical protein